MEQVSEQINPAALKDFVRHLCIVTKKHHERETARTGLERQIKKVKTVSLEKKPKRWLIEKELKNLSNAVSLVLEKESQLFGMEKKDSADVTELKKRVQQLETGLAGKEGISHEELMENREKINALSETLTELKDRVKEAFELKAGREKRIKELEKKIKAAPKKVTPRTYLLSEQIRILEEKYNKMKGKYSKEDLERVESKIKALKNRMAGGDEVRREALKGRFGEEKAEWRF